MPASFSRCENSRIREVSWLTATREDKQKFQSMEVILQGQFFFCLRACDEGVWLIVTQHVANTHQTVSTHCLVWCKKETSSQLQHIEAPLAPLPNCLTKSEMDSQKGQDDAQCARNGPRVGLPPRNGSPESVTIRLFQMLVLQDGSSF